MDLTVLDYAILAVTLGGAVVGLFIGFSGSLGFLAGFVAAVAAGRFGWVQAAAWIGSDGLRALADGVVALLVFGLVRMLVQKCVHGLVAQPGDAIFGLVFAALAGAVVSLGTVWVLGLVMPDNPNLVSVLLERVLSFVTRS